MKRALTTSGGVMKYLAFAGDMDADFGAEGLRGASDTLIGAMRIVEDYDRREVAQWANIGVVDGNTVRLVATWEVINNREPYGWTFEDAPDIEVPPTKFWLEDNA